MWVLSELTSFISWGTTLAGFAIGFTAGIYAKDYREDRDWCRAVDTVLEDISETVGEIRGEESHKRIELRRQAKHLDQLISETPPYRHQFRRQLEPLQNELSDLAETATVGIPLTEYESGEADSRGNVNRIDDIMEQADEVRDRTHKINEGLSYSLIGMIPAFLYHNVLPHKLRWR